MVSTETDLEQISAQYEEMELTMENENSKSDVYLNLLAIYILQNDLVQAKFLWKRIPENLKSCCPQLESLWKVGKLLWARDFPAVYVALNQDWPADITTYITALKEKLQTRVIHLVSKAYSNIKIDEFSQQLGTSNQEAVEVALKHKWEIDNDAGFIHPKSPDHAHSNETAITSEQQLAYLTDFQQHPMVKIFLDRFLKASQNRYTTEAGCIENGSFENCQLEIKKAFASVFKQLKEKKIFIPLLKLLISSHRSFEMGLHVDVSALTREECSQIIGVIAKDIALRRSEQERVRKLKKGFDETRKEITLKSSKRRSLDNNCVICGRLLLKYFCFFQRGQQCIACEHMACSTCRRVLIVDKQDKHYLCFLCAKKRDVQRKSFGWFYEAVDQRFKRFGSAKVLRGIYRCQNADAQVMTLIGLTREMTYVGARFSSSRRSSAFKAPFAPAGTRPESPATSCLSSDTGEKNEIFGAKTKRSKSTDDLIAKRLNPAVRSRKISAPAKFQFQTIEPEKEIIVRSLEMTAEEKSGSSCGNSEFEIISVDSTESIGASIEKASFTVKFFGDVEFIALASAALMLAFFLSLLACVGYIDDCYLDSEEDEKSEQL